LAKRKKKKKKDRIHHRKIIGSERRTCTVVCHGVRGAILEVAMASEEHLLRRKTLSTLHNEEGERTRFKRPGTLFFFFA
jgi:hypothetical protein